MSKKEIKTSILSLLRKVLLGLSVICFISCSAWTSAASSWRLGCACVVLDPLALGRLTNPLRTAAPMALISPPAALTRLGTTPFCWRSSASSRCNVSTWALPAADALCTASLMASWAILVNCACMVPPFAALGRLHPWDALLSVSAVSNRFRRRLFQT